MCHVCPVDFVCKEKIIIILTKTIVFTIVMVKPNKIYVDGDGLGEGNWGTTSVHCSRLPVAYTSTAVAGHRHGRSVRCIGLDVVDAVFRARHVP